MQTWLIYLIIFLEGYVVLAAELLMMRQLMPHVGSATDIMAIIIAAVLLPLAVGYHRGGQQAATMNVAQVRQRLARNFVIAGVFFTVGFVHIHLASLFELMDAYVTTNRWLKTGIYCGVFAVYPVYLLGQTLPLLTTTMPKDDLSRATGRMLFYSTLGSFGGSIFSTLVLMSVLGVHHTFTITLGLLLLMVVLLQARVRSGLVFLAVVLMAYTAVVNSDAMLTRLQVVQNNAYSLVEAHETPDGTRQLSVNRSFSSMIGPGETYKYFSYVEFINRYVLQRLAGDAPKQILVVGAGGFTLGRDDMLNHYTYLDIDPDLKATAETYFLKEELGPNKEFKSESVRSFLRHTDTKYDAIVVDAFTNLTTMPADLVTEDFFKQVRGALKPGGVMAANILTSATFQSAFSRNIDTTLRAVFPYISRQILYTSENIDRNANVIYVYYHLREEEAPKAAPYRDLLNRHFWYY